jgi:hypothetical protein
MEIETSKFMSNPAFLEIINIIYVHKALVAPLIVYGFFLDRVITCLLIISLITGILLVYQSKRLVVFTCLLPINVPHFLQIQEPFSLHRWDTITLFFRLTDVSVIITSYLSILIAIYLICRGLKKRRVENKSYIRLYTYFASKECKGNKIEKEGQKRLYIWFALNITCLLALCGMLDGGSILKLATWLEYDDLANWVKGEPILCHLFLWPINACISTILVAFYEGYQYGKNWLITNYGITTFRLVHLTLFSFLPILFFLVYLGQPWPIVAKVYLYQFSWFIKSLSYDEMVFVGTVLMGFLPVISVIMGRQVREKPAKELWKYLVALVFGISVALRLDHLLLMILDASFVNNLLVVLANLGILVTIPLGTLPIRLPHITLNMFDDRVNLRLPPQSVPSQQGGGVNPGLRDQPSSFIVHKLKTSINPDTRNFILPPTTGSTAPLRWAIDDMVERRIRWNIDDMAGRRRRSYRPAPTIIDSIPNDGIPTYSPTPKGDMGSS